MTDTNIFSFKQIPFMLNLKQDQGDNILFTDGGGKLLLTQVVSPRYSIQDDGVLFFLFELCECLRIVVSDY